jgi:hypothetical protein
VSLCRFSCAASANSLFYSYGIDFLFEVQEAASQFRFQSPLYNDGLDGTRSVTAFALANEGLGARCF